MLYRKFGFFLAIVHKGKPLSHHGDTASGRARPQFGDSDGSFQVRYIDVRQAGILVFLGDP